jgi:DNA polymerase-3 subunit gamma/tau
MEKGIHDDVIEIDGASHTGVDDIRALIETMRYAPAHGRSKVYIIDEVHMLSTSAFNALLKSIEEPPSHVVFILATTELDRVPMTIQSRCQIYHLRKIPDSLLVERLQQILQREQIPFDPGALPLLARHGEGSMRDALSLLDQAVALGNGRVTLESLQLLTPTQGQEFFVNALSHLIAKDAPQILTFMQELSLSGFDYHDAVDRLSELAHYAFLAASFGLEKYPLSALPFSEQALALMEKISLASNPLLLTRLFKVLRHLSERLHGSNLDHLVMENYLLEWCFDPGRPLLQELLTAQSAPTAAAKSGSAATDRSSPSADSLKSKSNPVKTASAGANHISLSKRLHLEDGNPAIAGTQSETQRVPLQKEMAKQPPLIAPTRVAAASPEQKAPEGVAAIAETVAPSVDFPKSWQLMLERWKTLKPLQARKLEEVVPETYSPQLIVLRYDPQSLSGKELGSSPMHVTLMALLKEAFSFQGELKLQAQSTSMPPKSDAQSVLSEKIKRKSQQRADVEEQMRLHPLTQAMVEKFQAKIDRIEITDVNLLTDS